ncbi:hypothetical protein VTN96DRAFT_2507 [Rasamsonia emersonii]|uniref:Regulator of G protein signaling domain protein RgsD n=1 Tax=Rasamsonia emersonii (strain ATCC 16479 / CBS 393.64 / IMI 116815) TaxID=1408163 RepID=A0A0F4YUH8_RASE3|nr:Regulator of G protein signaling domain protein RgsD [Rasamsonia emersonii CBS 393.64]KKA21511.1 Regulator of G protein signaling domain protein RgsD [Rasamsonia emersonii CBS 393.64]
MIAKALHLPLSLWNLTPDPTPETSPTSSVDYDCYFNEKEMDSRPLSLAIPSRNLCQARPTLDEVLSNTAPYPFTLSAFMAYLSQNHCLETLEFTMEAKRYAETYRTVSRMLDQSPICTECPQTEHLRMLWHRLISAYIEPGSPREINLSSEVRDALLAETNSTMPPPPETLDAAVRRMHDLMEESIFIHFLNNYSAPSSGSPYNERMNLSNTSLEEHHGNRIRQVGSRGRRPSPQSSFADFASHRGPVSGRLTKSGPATKTGSRVPGHASMSSGDSGSPVLTDDSGSALSSPVVGEPMTPPTTPPSSDLNIQTGYGSKARSESNAWKKMGMKLGFKRRHGGSTSRDPRLEE